MVTGARGRGLNGRGLTGGGHLTNNNFLCWRRLRAVAIVQLLSTFPFPPLVLLRLKSLSQSRVLLCCFKIKPVQPATECNHLNISVKELIYCLSKINFEYLFYKKKHRFLHSLMSCKNDVFSSVMEVFVSTEEYIKA